MSTNQNPVPSSDNQSESSISHLYQVTAPGHIGAVLSEEETLINVENQSQCHRLVPLLHQLPLQRGQSRVLQHIVHCFSVQLQAPLTQLSLLEFKFVTIQVQVQVQRNWNLRDYSAMPPPIQDCYKVECNFSSLLTIINNLSPDESNP